MAIEWKKPAPGHEEILTSVSAECTRFECEKCPGLFTRDDYPNRFIMCVHECHRVMTDVSPECEMGECGKCSGTFTREDYPNQSITCIHTCHGLKDGAVTHLRD